MLRNNSKSLGNHLVSPEEKERLQWEGFAEKEGFEFGMKERVGDEKLLAAQLPSTPLLRSGARSYRSISPASRALSTCKICDYFIAIL